MVNKELVAQINAAKAELRLAEQDENYADPEYIDIAIRRVTMAKEKLNTLFRQAKLYSV